MQIMRYGDAVSFPFGHLVVRDMTPTTFSRAILTEIEVPIGADNPPFAAAANDKVYVGITGEIQFSVGGEAVRVKRGDVLLIEGGEQFSYHNGGYEMGRLFVIQVPHGTG
jgi:mannose-6-phosphate isomerase-like protein (cupin superfamily)